MISKCFPNCNIYKVCVYLIIHIQQKKCVYNSQSQEDFEDDIENEAMEQSEKLCVRIKSKTCSHKFIQTVSQLYNIHPVKMLSCLFSLHICVNLITVLVLLL